MIQSPVTSPSSRVRSSQRIWGRVWLTREARCSKNLRNILKMTMKTNMMKSHSLSRGNRPSRGIRFRLRPAHLSEEAWYLRKHMGMKWLQEGTVKERKKRVYLLSILWRMGSVRQFLMKLREMLNWQGSLDRMLLLIKLELAWLGKVLLKVLLGQWVNHLPC